MIQDSSVQCLGIFSFFLFANGEFEGSLALMQKAKDMTPTTSL
jgi:hypothetical protein